MHTVSYYKLGRQWFLDLPSYVEAGGDVEDLERIGAFHDFLEYTAEGASEVRFMMALDPFEGANVFEFSGSSGEKSGAYYQVSVFEGKQVYFELWFNVVLVWSYTQLPERIYVKRLTHTPPHCLQNLNGIASEN